jgi:hypothetical protein
MTAARGRLRASDADREQVIDVLKVAFTQGRLTKDDLDLRAAQAFISRTYAELAAVTADIPVSLVAVKPVRAPRQTRPRRSPARVRDGPPTNPLALKCGLGLATIVLPAMIAVALGTRNQNLFIGTVVLLIAYFLALLIVIANSVARRFENESSGESEWGRL